MTKRWRAYGGFSRFLILRAHERHNSRGTGMRQSSMMTKAVSVAAALGVTAVFAAGLQIATATSSFAYAPKPFQLTKVTPDPEILNVKSLPGTATKVVKVHWKGTAAFPITLHITPEPGCSTSFFTCYPTTVTYTSGTHALPRTSTCTINAGPSGSFTGRFDYQLVDANGQTTGIVAETYTCNW
jgi:hypothetical protein